jgi:hypothetical protein
MGIQGMGPYATAIYLIGDFRKGKRGRNLRLPEFRITQGMLWQPTNCIIKIYTSCLSNGREVGESAYRHGQEELCRIGYLIFSAQIWDPPETYVWKHAYARPPVAPLILRSACWDGTEECRIGTFEEFAAMCYPGVKAG